MIDLKVLGERASIENAISLLAQPWGVSVPWQSFVGQGPHTLRFDTVRIDVSFVEPTSIGIGANIRIIYHGTPMADHLLAISQALEIFQPNIEVGGITRLSDIPIDWPCWAD